MAPTFLENGEILQSCDGGLKIGFSRCVLFKSLNVKKLELKSPTDKQPPIQIIHANLAPHDKSNDVVQEFQDFDLEASPVKELQQNGTLLKKASCMILWCLTTIYDLLTLPLYFFNQRPWKRIAAHNVHRGILIDKEKLIYGSATPRSKLNHELFEMNIDTIEKVFSYAISKYGTSKCVGSRDVIREVEILDPVTKKPVEKLGHSDYKWMTFAEVNTEAKNISAGLASIVGLHPKSKIAIFAETRKEWLITAMAAFKQNLTIVTVYTTLGDDGVVHALQETEVSCLITSEGLMSRLVDILVGVPTVKNVIYFNPRNLISVESILPRLPSTVCVISYSDLVTKGKSTYLVEVKPSSKNIAIIMYTSGSTGNPKGVMLSHLNIVSALRSALDACSLTARPEPDDIYIAYLPLAHVLELMSEMISFIQGIPIGYSSPHTLTDQSPLILDGTKGDASVLRPTIISAVPLVLERVGKAIQTKIDERGKIARHLFDYFYSYKVKWYKRGYDTPLVNKLMFEKFKAVIGGRVRVMAVGSASLANELQEFIRTVLCCDVVLGYGMTESSCCGTIGVGSDLSLGRIGAPVQGTEIRLMSWAQGGYHVTDKPRPRGEIIMGGDNIAMGYYKQEDGLDFFEENGKRWIRTGDIGEVYPDGVFKIIDRKKDLMKLSHGEYISLGNIESILKACKYVENVCICADSMYPYPVALIVPEKTHLEKLAKKLGVQDFEDFNGICQNQFITKAVLHEVQDHLRRQKMTKFEIPKKIHLCPGPWMPQSGLVTAAFKLKRFNVLQHYKAQINDMYQQT